MTNTLTPMSTAMHVAKTWRRALIVGINYTSIANKAVHLNGCINDVQRLCAFVQSMATAAHPVHVKVLTDDPVKLAVGRPGSHADWTRVEVVNSKPTRASIEAALKWLVADADNTSRLWFSYSGHGSSLPDDNNDECDKRDEALVPLDYATAGLIRDDWLRNNVVNVLPAGAQLTCMVDACHSGTGFDLRITLEDMSVFKQGRRKQKRTKTYTRGEWRRVQRRVIYDEIMPSECDVMMISGCRDHQTSADAKENGDYTGALTHAFLKHVDACRTPSDLLQDMTTWLRVNKYSQRPVLSFGAENPGTRTQRSADGALRFL